MTQTEKLYEGKAKIIYPTDNPDVFLTYFKDDATAFNAQKRGTIQDKGEVNCIVSTALFKHLESKGIPTHFIEQKNSRKMLVKAVKIIPVEVVVRNIAAGSLCKQTGLPEGKQLPYPLVEFYLKDDALGDPLLTMDRLFLLNVATEEQIQQLKTMTLQINQYLSDFFRSCNIILVDFKLEFGIDSQGNLLLADEISPDTCRLWDTLEQDPQARVLDKDRFRRDLGSIESAYQQVRERVLTQIAKLNDNNDN
jgi:phosphoribosylaminoimidazole-succinocarboxamide synthase